MEVFNLADKLIEERQKNKELQERIGKVLNILEKQIPVWKEWSWDGSDICIDDYIYEIQKILKGSDNNG